jgi:hypothetical protein
LIVQLTEEVGQRALDFEHDRLACQGTIVRGPDTYQEWLLTLHASRHIFHGDSTVPWKLVRIPAGELDPRWFEEEPATVEGHAPGVKKAPQIRPCPRARGIFRQKQTSMPNWDLQLMRTSSFTVLGPALHFKASAAHQ